MWRGGIRLSTEPVLRMVGLALLALDTVQLRLQVGRQLGAVKLGLVAAHHLQPQGSFSLVGEGEGFLFNKKP